MNKFLKIFSMVIASVLTISLFCGCDDTSSRNWEEQDYYAYSFNIHGDGVMPIGAWVSPPPGMMGGNIYYPTRITDDDYRTYSESGLNFLTPLYEDYNKTEYQEEIITSLMLAEKYNLAYIMQDSKAAGAAPQGITTLAGFAGLSESSTQSEILFVENEYSINYNAYKDYKSFAGVRFLDEPGYVNYKGLLYAKNYLDKQGNGHLTYTNLFPSYATQAQLYYGAYYNGPPNPVSPDPDLDFRKYLETFCETVKPEFLSIDYYPFINQIGTDKGIMDGYFECISIAADVAHNYQIPLWVFIQAFGLTPHTPTSRTPDETDLRWQVNTSLVYGAKGIQYFTYYQLPNWDVPENSMGMINRDGQKTNYYSYVQNVNKHIKAIEQTMMKSTLMGHIGTNLEKSPALFIESSVIQTGKFREVESITSDGSFVTGCFDKSGKTVLYVVNNSIEKGESYVNIHFDKKVKFKIVQNAKSFTQTSKGVILNVKNGDGVMIEIL